MKLHETIERLEKSKEFIAWNKKHKDKYFLAHCFVMLDELNKHIWQVGYYNKEKDTITTFVVEPDDIKMVEDAAVFKEPNTHVQAIDIKKVKIDIDKVMDIADKTQQQHYKGCDPLKVMIILQNLSDFGQVFNVTFVIRGMRTLNFKLDSSDGKVKEHKMVELFSLSEK